MRSSELNQKPLYKRLAVYSRNLPVASDFGSAPYPVILSQWNDPQVGNQIVTSTYNGTDVSHWVSLGVNSSTGTLDCWDQDGVYKQVIREADIDDESFKMSNRKLTLKPSSSSELGGIKLGPTLKIDGDGIADITISPTSIKIVANQAAMLTVPTSTGAQLVIQQDTSLVFGIEASQDTAVLSNWKQIGTVATSVISFKDRAGAVTPEKGDYTQDQIVTKHDDTGTEGYFGIDNNGIYYEDGL